jgi:ribosomal-protein-serine acetyltransferase
MAKIRVHPPLVIDELVVREYTMDDLQLLDDAIVTNREYLLPWIGPWILKEPIGLDARRALLAEWVEKYPVDGADQAIGIFCAGQLVGGTGLHDRNEPHDVEVGYWVDEEWQGRGIATRVTKALTDYAFRFPEVHRVLLKHNIDNLKSRRIPEKLGFSIIDNTGACSCGDEPHTSWAVTREQWLAREGVVL